MGESNARTAGHGHQSTTPTGFCPNHDSFSGGAEHLLRADPFNGADAGAGLGYRAAGRSVDNRHR